jgi:hypothetical protein
MQRKTACGVIPQAAIFSENSTKSLFNQKIQAVADTDHRRNYGYKDQYTYEGTKVLIRDMLLEKRVASLKNHLSEKLQKKFNYVVHTDYFATKPTFL